MQIKTPLFCLDSSLKILDAVLIIIDEVFTANYQRK